MLSVAEQFLEQQMHPTVVISAYRRALDDMLESLKEIRYVAVIQPTTQGGVVMKTVVCVCVCVSAPLWTRAIAP